MTNGGFTALSTIGMLGYGIPEQSFRRGVELRPGMIGADAGSTDAGPHKLGRGVPDVSRDATRRDIDLMLQAGLAAKIPVIIGSAGGSGAKNHVQWTWEIVQEIAAAKALKLKVAVIHSDISNRDLKLAFAAGRVQPLGAAPPLDAAAIDATVSIVAQMGVEPIMEALDGGADLVIAGRACDAAIFAAPAIRAGADPGLAWHMGEILECGAMCAEPGSGSDCMLGVITDDRFVLQPTNPIRRCTPLSVAAHSLYERSYASQSAGPGHVLDMSQTRFEALDERRVAVSGTRLRRTASLRFKIEGSRPAGFRTIVICGIRDPIAVERIDEMLEGTKAATTQFFAHQPDYTLRFIVYGRDGVMGRSEPTPVIDGHEVGLMIDVVAPSQEQANTVCAYARALLQHYHYEGIKATGANLAFPTAPSDIPCGSIYSFSVYHLLEVDSPMALFPVEYRDLGH